MSKKDKVEVSLRNVSRNFKDYRMCIVSIVISICVMGCFVSIYEASKTLINNELERDYEKKQMEIYIGNCPELDTEGWTHFTEADIKA